MEELRHPAPDVPALPAERSQPHHLQDTTILDALDVSEPTVENQQHHLQMNECTQTQPNIPHLHLFVSHTSDG